MTYLGRLDHQIKVLGAPRRAGRDRGRAARGDRRRRRRRGRLAADRERRRRRRRVRRRPERRRSPPSRAALARAAARLHGPARASSCSTSCRSTPTASSTAERCSSPWRPASEPRDPRRRPRARAGGVLRRAGRLRQRAGDVGDDFDLREQGVIDSLGFLELITGARGRGSASRSTSRRCDPAELTVVGPAAALRRRPGRRRAGRRPAATNGLAPVKPMSEPQARRRPQAAAAAAGALRAGRRHAARAPAPLARRSRSASACSSAPTCCSRPRIPR